MDTKLKSILYSSVSDYLTVDRIYTCLIKSRINLYIIFNGKYVYDKYTTREDIQERDRYLVFICSVIISSKLYMDHSYTNESWTGVSHIPCVYISRVERKILEGIDYDIKIPYRNMEKMYEEYHSTPKTTTSTSRGLRGILKLIFCM
ncbi:cyclin-like protein [Vairimorpha necatrix]|uniref:Cyclin-like protein n=1 Tax=Vairimorpha necatrix TaxID=6039 RepID=A0AAX4JFL0_9MICR